MAYPSDGDPIKHDVLEALRANMEAIEPPSYHHDVRRAEVFGGQEIQLGRSLPAIVIVPEKDQVDKYLTCQRIQNVMDVTVYGAVRVIPGSTAWRKSIQWLLADIKAAVNADFQLSGQAVYIDLVGEDLPEIIDSNIAVGSVSLRVAYRHDFLNPTN
jgi:hypothetical protein